MDKTTYLFIAKERKEEYNKLKLTNMVLAAYNNHTTKTLSSHNCIYGMRLITIMVIWVKTLSKVLKSKNPKFLSEQQDLQNKGHKKSKTIAKTLTYSTLTSMLYTGPHSPPPPSRVTRKKKHFRVLGY